MSHREFATIMMMDTLGPVYICRGYNKDSAVAFLLVIREPNGFSMSPLSLNAQPDGSFRSTLDIRPYTNRSTFFPLDVEIQAGRLAFRWMLSGVGTPPGGVPVSADVAIDEGKPFPLLNLVTLDGESIASSSFKGRITVINSWSTWCSGCVAEIPGFNSLVDKYGRRVRFISIAQNTPDELRRFLERRPFDFTQAMGNEESVRLMGSSYPRTVILDEGGTIVFDRRGGSVDSYKEVDSQLERLTGGK